MNVAVTNIIKRLAVIISVFAIAWCLIDPVYADNEPTYSVVDDCFVYLTYTQGSNTNYAKFHADSPINAFLYTTSNTLFSGTVYLVSNSSFRYWITSGSTSTSCPAEYYYDSYSATVNNTTFYYATFYLDKSNVTNTYLPINSNAPVTGDDKIAYYYVYGDGAIDPAPDITYGLLDDVGFTTDIAGTGNASTSNLDTISWNPVYDSNGNNIMGASVSIRAVPGHYSADSKQNLFEKVRSDFILDNTDLAVLDNVNVEEGSFSITWGQVISAFSLPFGNFISWFKTDEVFLKQGWIYQIQFTKGEYTSEWQTVYTIQSESPSDSLHVINSTVIDQDTVNILQQINTVNNSTNIWIINDTPVDPNDNYTPPATDDEKPWWAYLLEMINNSIGITNKYINDGTDESQQVVNNIETNNNDLDITVTEYHDIENDLVTDMNDKITDLDIEENLSSDASFLSSARWVTEQFNTIVSNNPIGMILKFSLVLGFVTIFLGRFR